MARLPLMTLPLIVSRRPSCASIPPPSARWERFAVTITVFPVIRESRIVSEPGPPPVAFQMPPPEKMKEVFEKIAEERRQWKTIDDCERVCKENSEKLYEVIRSVSEADFEISVHLPFGGGMDRSLADVMMFHYWNIVYHVGQINFIQTLYGDKEMH